MVIETIHIAICMKPVDGTFADNALEHGVSGLNIDDCRIDIQEKRRRGSRGLGGRLPGDTREDKGAGMFNGKNERFWNPPDGGRWPPNVILERAVEIVEQFPQGQPSKSKKPGLRDTHSQNEGWSREGHDDYEDFMAGYSDTGSNARFFYQYTDDD